MSREPKGSNYDAEVGLFPYGEGKVALQAYVLVKVTYETRGDRMVIGEPEPLARDFRDPEYEPRLPTGTDFWVNKAAADVVVQGNCYLTRPGTSARVKVKVGQAHKQIAVFGPRRLVWQGGQRYFTPAEVFTEMPIVRENAYGGYDGRVFVKKPDSIEEEVRLAYDHPGLYPRNPFGKGYVVIDEPVEDGIELPNLENPIDLLTPDRIVVGDPREWWKQPLPWSLDHLHPLQFPRYVYFGTDAWHPGPENAAMPEVAQGYIEENYRQIYGGRDVMIDRLPADALQEGSLGMTFGNLAAGTPIEVSGMHPEGRIFSLQIPAAPELELAFDNDVERVPARITNVVVQPNEEKVMFTWVGFRTQMPRRYIPGIHGKIPLAARIARSDVLRYETPEPMPKKLKAARENPAPDNA